MDVLLLQATITHDYTDMEFSRHVFPVILLSLLVSFFVCKPH